MSKTMKRRLAGLLVWLQILALLVVAAPRTQAAAVQPVRNPVIEGTTPEDAISQAQAAIGNAAKNGERLCASPLARSCTSGKYVIRLTKL